MRPFTCKEVPRLLRRSRTVSQIPVTASSTVQIQPRPWKHAQKRWFGRTKSLLAVKPYLLADIGEGITECQIIQWFVKPGARVEQFDPICEVQSDKASVEITSRFDGVIKKLYYEPDDMAKVGKKPLVDIDIQSEISPVDEALLNEESKKESKQNHLGQTEIPERSVEVGRHNARIVAEDVLDPGHPSSSPYKSIQQESGQDKRSSKHGLLATPAVRHMIKEQNLNIEDIQGTGKDGRVLKEDVQNHIETMKQAGDASSATTLQAPILLQQSKVEDRIQPLTLVQSGMFKQMTRSLSIPHFLYTDSVDFSFMTMLRKKYNTSHDKNDHITPLPYILKAISLAFQNFPLLNAHLDTSTNSNKPQMIVRGSHDIGIAIDSPSGLLVPVIKKVQNHSVASLALEIRRLSNLARSGKLTPAHLSGATFTVSNIGSIGGTAVAPVIVGPQVSILGIGRARVVPAFGANGEMVKREECIFSWSADHRVVDGAYVAKAAEQVRKSIENVEEMLMRMR